MEIIQGKMPKYWVQFLGEDKTRELCRKYNSACKECGSKTDLTIHHIDGRGWARKSKKAGLIPNNELSNLVILCRRCHGSLEGKYGAENRIYSLKKSFVCRKCQKLKPRASFILSPNGKINRWLCKQCRRLNKHYPNNNPTGRNQWSKVGSKTF
jgi:hypothetical protein